MSAATGAGKSTILNLIGRYFDIQKGQILIDGIDIHEIDLDVLRGAIGQVQRMSSSSPETSKVISR